MRFRSLSLLGLALALAGCVAPSRAPGAYVPSERVVSDDPRGAWATVATADEQVRAGELLAVEADSLLLLTPSDQVVPVARANVETVRLEAYRNRAQGTTAWAGFGLFSSLSHGYFGSLSAPVWGSAMLVGSLDESGAGYMSLRRESLGEAAPYARFPQGMPEGLDRSRLRLIGGWY